MAQLLTTALISFLAALVVSTFVEYAVHRLMHAGVMVHARHVAHHKDGWGQGFWLEFRDYLLPGLLLMLPPWLLGPVIGAAWTLGCVATAAFIAYAHQLQHDNPLACRWMRVPVHYVHHRDQMWHHNFGMSTDLWDRLLGTYKLVAFGDEFRPEEHGRGPFEIHWGPHQGDAAEMEAIARRRQVSKALARAGSPGASG